MGKKILIVEDESVIAFDLELILINAGYQVCGIADSVPEALEIIETEKPQMVLLDIHLKGALTGIDLAKQLTELNIPYVYLSANFHTSVLEMAKATQAYGFMVKPFREKELLIALDVAFYRHNSSMESKIRQESLFENGLAKILDTSPIGPQGVLTILSALQPYIPFDLASISIKAGANFFQGGISFLRTGFNEYQQIGEGEFRTISHIAAQDFDHLRDTTAFLSRSEMISHHDLNKKMTTAPLIGAIIKAFNLSSYLNKTLLSSEGEVLALTFFSKKAEVYQNEHLNFLNNIQPSLSAALEELWLREHSGMKTKEKERPITVDLPSAKQLIFDNIIGNSHQMLHVQDLISIVAPLDTSVLILGESGTGKERIAKSIHQLSARRNNALVIVNCASLPPSLIESELFGHEKGAFTGAFEKRIGKFELADKGTVFLDEIGEMTPELQVKLLRVLQEQEVERIGSKKSIKVDLRIIAATNRDLHKEVEEGRFRLDLYYRLFVFPIIIPPLRERVEDIMPLATHFLEYFRKKNGRDITGFTPRALAQMQQYPWPGNVRELEHLVERSMLMAGKGLIDQLMFPGSTMGSQPASLGSEKLKTIDENAREHIVNVLKKCNWKVGGPGGAAEILDIPVNTLHSKIKKLGITKEDYL